MINPLSISRYTRIQYITSIGLFYNILGIFTLEFIWWVLFFNEKRDLWYDSPLPPPLLILILKEQMSFVEKWDKAFDARDRDALAALLDDEFVFVRHQSGKEIPKEDMLNMWTSDGPRVVLNNYRVIYENDDIVVTHRFIDFPSGDKEAVLGVINLKNGKGIRMETGATPMPS